MKQAGQHLGPFCHARTRSKDRVIAGEHVHPTPLNSGQGGPPLKERGRRPRHSREQNDLWTRYDHLLQSPGRVFGPLGRHDVERARDIEELSRESARSHDMQWPSSEDEQGPNGLVLAERIPDPFQISLESLRDRLGAIGNPEQRPDLVDCAPNLLQRSRTKRVGRDAHLVQLLKHRGIHRALHSEHERRIQLENRLVDDCTKITHAGNLPSRLGRITRGRGADETIACTQPKDQLGDARREGDNPLR